VTRDKNKGWFSRLTAGGGTDDRYSLGYCDCFNEDRMSVLGSSNNINSPGFSFDEIYDQWVVAPILSVVAAQTVVFGINELWGNGGITSSRVCRA
jgi:hypothetical protein